MSTTEDQAYRELVEPHRAELRAHCYRMLGSVQDAEDALQEALLRAWRGLPRFAGRSSIRSWLYKIATNTCLDQIAKRPNQRVLPIDYGPQSDAHAGPGVPLVDRLARPLQRAVDRGDGHVERVAGLLRREVEHLAQDQHGALARRQVLERGDERELDALARLVPSLG